MVSKKQYVKGKVLYKVGIGRMNRFTSKPVAPSFLHLAIDVAQPPHFRLILFSRYITLPKHHLLTIISEPVTNSRMCNLAHSEGQETIHCFAAHRSMYNFLFVSDFHLLKTFSWPFPTWYMRPVLPN